MITSSNAEMSTSVGSGGKRRFNLLDLLIIISLLAVAAAAVFSYFPVFGNSGGKASVIRAVFVIERADERFSTAISEGDGVLFVKGETAGTVESVKTEQAYDYIAENGTAVKKTVPGSVRITVTVSSDAVVSDTGCTVSGIKLSAGSGYDLVFPGYSSHAECVSITAAEGN